MVAAFINLDVFHGSKRWKQQENRDASISWFLGLCRQVTLDYYSVVDKS